MKVDLEDWAVKDVLALAKHLKSDHPGADVPDPECETCLDLVLGAEESADIRLARAGERLRALLDYQGGFRSQMVEVCLTSRDGETEFMRLAAYPPGATVGQIACLECSGSGWWGYGPTEADNGECVDCKGTGRVWVGLL